MNIILDDKYHPHGLNDWRASFVQPKAAPIDYPIKNVYPISSVPLPDPTGLEGCRSLAYHPVRPPSVTPPLSVSVSSPASASSSEEEDVGIAYRAPLLSPYSNGLIQRMSLVDRLVEISSSVIDAIWGLSMESQNIKVVPTAQFVREILKRSKSTYSTLQAALYYIFRIKVVVMERMAKRSTCRVEKPTPQDCIFCGRRMFLAALMLASKFLQDKTYRNCAWAKISGLSTSEITLSEMAFLQLIDYQLFISKPTFERWHSMLTQHINQVMEALPVRTSKPPSSLLSLHEPCNYTYGQHDLKDRAKQHHDPSYNISFVDHLGFVHFNAQSKRFGRQEQTQPRKKICQ